MLNKILTFSLQNRLMILLGALVLSLTGIYYAKNINIDVFPDLTAPTVTILTEAHGLESEEVETLVTYQIETALNGSPNVRRIRSSSAVGISIVWVEFEWGTDIYKARQIVSERFPIIQENLPTGVGSPVMAPISSIMGEIMLLGVTSDSLSPMELRTVSDWTIRPMIKSIGGIANVVVIGGEYKEYQVFADQEKLRFFNISIEELYEKVMNANSSAPGGVINQHGNQYIIKGNGRAYSLEHLEEAVVKETGGQPVKIRDVATVQVGSSDKIGDGSMNAKPSVIITISKQPDVNTLELTEKLEDNLVQIKKALPEGVFIESHIFRQSDFIETSISNLNQTLLEGAFFVVIVLFIFLMNWRTTIISLVAIPVSLLVSIIVLKEFGYTINTMSLGGMAIAIGALVDDAIIDVENVFKRLRQNVLLDKDKRQAPLKVIHQASIEIRSSIIIATLIIIVSFVPLFFLGGMEGRLLKPLGIAFITSVLTSLMIAVTLTPVLCSYLLTSNKTLKNQSKGTVVEHWLQGVYKKVLHIALAYPKLIISGTALFFILSLTVIFNLGRSFLPEFNEGSMVISVVGLPGMSLEESSKIGKQVENLLLEFPEIQVVTRRTGRAELDEHAQGVNAAEIDAPFALSEKSKDQFFSEVREKLSIVPANITIGQPIAHRIDHMLSGTRANIAIKVFGNDLQRLFEIGKEIETKIKPIENLADVAVDQQIEVPQIRITPKRSMLAAYGMTAEDLMHQIDIALAGEKAGEVYEGQKYFDLVVRLVEEQRNEIEKLKRVLVKTPKGGVVPLELLSDIKSTGSPNSISREDVQRKIVIAANVQGGDLRGAVNEIRSIIESTVDLPEGYGIEYGGQFESEEKASQLLLLTGIGSIIVIFLLLYSEFKDLKLSFIVLINLPLALIGGIMIVYFTSGIISIAATIGFISLFGIATRNGILLVSRYEDLKAEQGIEGKELLLKGALDRLNPILMTAMTTALALIPLVWKGDEAGNEIQHPMAIVILGGLFTATLLNLVVIPCVYGLVRRESEGG